MLSPKTRAITSTRRVCDEAGQTIVEYALVVTLIAIASIGVLAVMTHSIDSVFLTLGNAL
jgi:Flp pilus assembly pilin Flp